MNVLVSRGKLLRLLSRCSAVADAKSTMPILANVLLSASDGGLRASATDLNLGFTAEVGAAVKKSGAIAVSARGLLERVKVMPDGDVLLTCDGSSLTVKASEGNRRFKVQGFPADEYPDLPEVPKTDAIEFDVATLLDLITVTSYAISSDETRLHLNSGYIEADGKRLTAAATDGHRLAVKETSSELRFAPLLIPLKAVHELKRMLGEAESETVKVWRDGYRMFCCIDGEEFHLKLSDAQFPPYKQVIPSQTERSFTVNVAALVEAVRSVKVAASDRTGGIALKLGAGKLRIESQSPEGGEGEDEIAVDFDGGEASVGVNSDYLIDALGQLTSETVTIQSSGELDPILITDGGYMAVLMPMRQ